MADAKDRFNRQRQATNVNVGTASAFKDASDLSSEEMDFFREHQPDLNFSVLQFATGEVYALRKDNRRYVGWQQFLKESLPADPIYVETIPGTPIVKSLLAPLPRRVDYISADEKTGSLEVVLLQCPTICYLNPNIGAEKFDRFRELLEYSAQSRKEVLVTTRPVTQEILDVRAFTGTSTLEEEPPDREEDEDDDDEDIVIAEGGRVQAGQQPQGAVAMRALAAGVAPISMARAITEFENLASQPQIPFAYVNDCCTARAHEMCRIMKANGLRPRKVWNYGHGWRLNNPRATLRVETNSVPAGFVTWSYHVAPIVRVKRDDGSTKEMVFDPSLFKGPVTIDEWVTTQEDQTSVQHRHGARYIWFNFLNGEQLTDTHFARTREMFRHHREQLNEANN